MSKIMELAEYYATLREDGVRSELEEEARAALQAEVEKLAAVEKDAARYRWLRERDDWVLMPGMRSEVCIRSNLDDQIDMSMGEFIGAKK